MKQLTNEELLELMKIRLRQHRSKAAHAILCELMWREEKQKSAGLSKK